MNRGDRFHQESLRTSDYRTAFQIDRDRILYSPHFARLAEVTQVRTIGGEFLVHNRLTHSLKVAQVSRRIAEVPQKKQPAIATKLSLDADVTEAAGLAHDLGHPPFGHIAEKKLNELVSPSVHGYEGNAQSFRILNALSVSDSAPDDKEFIPGLNLTRATLNAVVKYPWGYKANDKKLDKWGYYGTEAPIFDWAHKSLSGRSAEAEIMDWADDITYAIHDMVDFYCAGLIPLHLLANRRTGGDLAKREWTEFFDAVCSQPVNAEIAESRRTFEEALSAAFSLAGISGPFVGSQSQSGDLWRFASELISRYIGAISLNDPSEDTAVSITTAARQQTSILKQLTWHYVIRRSDLAAIQHGQKRMIEVLFEAYVTAISRADWELFPVGFAQLIRNSNGVEPARWAADYISGLTERQVMDLHRTLTGRHL